MSTEILDRIEMGYLRPRYAFCDRCRKEGLFVNPDV